MTIYIYDINRIGFTFRIRNYFKLKNSASYWKRDQSALCDGSKMEFPPASEYVELRGKAQTTLNNYFSRLENRYKLAPLISDYVKKTISPDFIDYYMYRVQVNRIKSDTDSAVVVKNFERIINGLEAGSWLSNIFQFIKTLLVFLISASRSLLVSLRASGKTNVEDIVYVRKQEKPDVFNFEQFEQYLSQGGQKLSKVYPLVRPELERHGVHYINAFEGSLSLWWRAILLTLSKGIPDLIGILKSRILAHIDSRFLHHALFINMMIEMRAKTYVGMLADKAMYNLMFRYKYSDQDLVVYLDGVCFDGNIIFHDLIYADVCLVSDQYAVNGFNKNGGNCRDIKLVGSFLTTSTPAEGNVSDEVVALTKEYKAVIMIASAQFNASSQKFDYLEPKYLDDFLDVFAEVVSEHQDVLFILKEKKGEFDEVDLDIFSGLNNVFIVRTQDPKEIKINHFDHLLHISDVVVSMAPNSSVIPSTLHANKLPLIYNQYRQKTPWKQYGDIEMDLENFGRVVSYWIDNIEDCSEIIGKMKSDFMLDKNFYEESAKQICSMMPENVSN